MRTRSVDLAMQAAQKVENVKRHPNAKVREEYARLAVSFPALLRASGLVAALGFVQAKVKEQIGACVFLEDFCSLLGLENESDWKAFQQSDSRTYALYFRFGMQAAELLKRYAEALLKQETDSSDEGA